MSERAKSMSERDDKLQKAKKEALLDIQQ